MGHDTFAFRDKAHAEKDDRDANFKRRDPEISYLRRSMGCSDNDLIYRALGPRATQHFAGVSGDGSEETFTKEEIRTALKKLQNTPLGAEDQIRFLSECLEHPGKSVLIGFY